MADELLLKEMGIRISKRRKEYHLTQEQIAEQMNVSLQMISNLELGKKAIRPENLVKLCRVLDVTADYILTGKKSASDVQSIASKLSCLPDDDVQMIETLIDFFIYKQSDKIIN